MASRIEELRAQLATVTEQAKAKALTKDEQEEAVLRAQIREQEEAAAAADATRRANDLAAREAAAQVKAGTAYLVAGVDLVSLFPLGKAPPSGQLPGNGVIIVRNPAPEVTDFVNREVEAKRMTVNAIMAKVLADCTVDPDPMGVDGVTLGEFCRAYPDAATQAASKARELGGAKTAADKRGRA